MIYEFIKKRGIQCLKILNLPIYISIRGYKGRKQIFLCGLFSTIKKVFPNGDENKKIKICNFTISQKTVKNGILKQTILGILIKNKNIYEDFAKRYSKETEGFDNIIILRGNSGEIYLFLTYLLKPFLKKNGIKKPLLIGTKKYHLNLIKMIQPQAKYCYIEKMPALKTTFMNTCGKSFYTILTSNHFNKVKYNIKTKPLGTVHYLYSIAEELGISESDFDFEQIKISPEAKEFVYKKIKEIGLNIDKFVFVAPEAYTCKELPQDFWNNLLKEIKAKGYDIFLNIMKETEKYLEIDYKSCFLTYEEAFYLASISKSFISLRSGLTESLMQVNVPIITFYTDFRDGLSVEYNYHGYCLNKMPCANKSNIFEYKIKDVNKMPDIKEFIDKINI